jgi:uncharacterized phage protein (TIGR01671 family)
MNRVIKFRGMTKANNVMVFGDLIVCPNGEHRILWFELKGEMPLDVDYTSFNETIQSGTIGQFTGLKDKNGKEIYEGDVLKSLGTDICVVRYIDKFACFMLEIINPIEHFDTMFHPLYEGYKHREVIGNIYENPELLITK